VVHLPADVAAGGDDVAERVTARDERLQYMAWRGATLAVPALPRPIDPGLARIAGALAYAFAPKARASVRANLEVVAPPLSATEREALVRRAFVNQARNYLATVRLPRLDPARVDLVIEGREHIERARASGRGIVIASAHFGPLPLVGPVGLARLGLPLSIIAEAIPPRLFDLLNRTLRGSLGASFLPASEALGIHRHLKRGEAIGVLGDRAVTGVGMRIPFFAREALLPIGHLHLAARTGAALLPSFAFPGDPPRGVILPPLLLETARGDDAMRENLRRWVAVLEGVIASAPDEWHVFERIWP